MITHRSVTPTPAHTAFRNEVIEVLKKYAGELDARDMLALSAHLVGQILAMQDQRTVTTEIALKIIEANIEQGNREAIANLTASRGSA